GRGDTVQLAVRFPASVSPAAIEAAVRRHEIFGTAFRSLPGVAVPLQLPGGIRADIREGEADAEPFDLERGPLLRVRLAGDGTAVFTASALVADAASLAALAADVVHPAPPEVQYLDYAEWQRETFGAAAPPASRPSSKEPSAHELDLPQAVDAAMLLAAWRRVLRGALPEWDGALAVAVHDRGDAALERTVGPFARVVVVDGNAADVLDRAAASPDGEDRDAGGAPGFAWLDVPEATPPVVSIRFRVTGSPLQVVAWRQGSAVHAALLTDGDGGWGAILASRVAAELRGASLSDADRARIESVARGRIESSWRETSLVTLFERHARRTPDRIALREGGTALTFAEVDRRANGLARALAGRGAGPEAVVALLADRGAGAIIGLLGILKSGAAYAPLAPDAPPLRLEKQIAIARATMAIARRAEANAIPRGIDPLFLEDIEPAGGTGRAVEPDHQACLIFTSGSTGTPKGVMVTHGGIASYVRSLIDLLGCRDDQPLSFATGGALITDLGNTAVFGALASGGTLHAASRESLTDAHAFRAFMQGVDVLKIVPSHYQALLTGTPADAAAVPRVALLFGGEVLPVPLFERVRALAPGCRVLNHYGPTETTIGSLVCDGFTPRAEEKAIPIGTPVANTTVRILRGDGSPARVGESGELFIGGAGVARGYADQPAATAERFVPDPFAGGGERLYRTGDLARLRADGRIEFLGRADQQVKIRGYRVEPAEIEQQLAAHPAVDDAAVLARIIKDEPRLVAFVAARRVARHTLANGLAVAEHRRHETEFFYRQIFERDPFAASGLDIPEGSVVFDVGANIGLFTLYAHLAAPRVRVFAFEPLPEVFARLSENAAGYGVDARLVNAAVGARAGECEITYFPEESCMSGLYSDDERDAAILARIHQNDPAVASLSDGDRARLVAERTAAVRIPARVVALSDVIREHGIEAVDLLKIDVERSEWDVLAGLADEDWPKIRQITIEAHDVDGRVARLAGMLRDRGFEVGVEQDPAVAGTELFDVHARRPGMPRAASRRLAIPPPPASVNEGSLGAFLAARLPEFMVPQAFVFVDAIPRTASGKIDRGLLLDAAGRHAPERAGDALATTAEEILAGVFSHVLGVERVGPADNFFTLGGDSIRSIQVRYRAAERGVTFTTEQLFAHPTVRELAAIAGSEAERETDVAPFSLIADQDRRKLPGGIEDAFPLTMLQSGMIFHGVYDERTALYHDVQRFVVEGSMEPVAFRAAIDRLLDRHAVLRTSFDLRSYSEPLQLVHEPGTVTIPLEIADLRALDSAAQTARVQAWVDSEKVTSFDLAVPPLVRFAVFVLTDRRFVFCLSTHHP
ncbi:MAG TPA: amino acid adenylation domain-containing protein, partial [Thermoanaerobaculia bacterium]|nr:amino acid adenylation domain-containing protein [Thermoanaerobaculia bacterium]